MPKILLSLLICLTGIAAASAQTAAPATTSAAPTPAPAPVLTAAERDRAVRYLHTTHDGFIAAIQNLSEKQWRFKPAPDRWSVAEVAEHIAVSESTIFGMVTGQILKQRAAPEKRSEVAGKDDLILTRVPDRSHKAQAPEALKPTSRFANEADTAKSFEASRAATIDFVQTTNEDLRDLFGPHPAFGTLDAYQWILLIAAHSDRHTKQILEVKADPNFPKD